MRNITNEGSTPSTTAPGRAHGQREHLDQLVGAVAEQQLHAGGHAEAPRAAAP